MQKYKNDMDDQGKGMDTKLGYVHMRNYYIILKNLVYLKHI